MIAKLWDIYKTFTKIGAILVGGGYVILPILKEEIVDKKNWISEDNLVDYYAISQSLPGLIAANISIFIGYKLRGKMGALAATLGMITTPFICIICLSSIIAQINNLAILKGIFWGIGLAVIILIISSVQELWHKAITDRFSLFMFCIFLFAILKWGISPTPIILSSILIGILYKQITKQNKSEQNK